MKHFVLVGFALFCSSSIANGTVVAYTSSTDFHAANPSATLIEDFEDAHSDAWGPHLPDYTGPRGLISFTPLDGIWEPNVTIAPPSFWTFAADLNGVHTNVLTTNGNEDFVGTLTNPAFALGLDVLLNDHPATLSFFSGSTLLATLIYDAPPVPGNNLAFGGIFSSEEITSFRWTATYGHAIDTGVDNIYAGPVAAAVPEPATWAMIVLGFGAIGLALRRRGVSALI